jgi:hypothetical protein
VLALLFVCSTPSSLLGHVIPNSSGRLPGTPQHGHMGATTTATSDAAVNAGGATMAPVPQASQSPSY